MIKILDCTLRDGGYVNDFNFGLKTIKEIIKGLVSANIEIVEVGFLKTSEKKQDKSLYDSVESINQYISNSDNRTMYVAMIAYGDISIDDISDSSKTSISGIRLTFHEKDIEEAFDFAKKLREKGYDVFIQPVGTAFYTDEQLLKLISKVNSFKPYAFYIVDTLGSMYEKDLLRMYYLIDNNLSKEIRIGFHAHNNLQLAFSNAQKLINLAVKRDIIIDASVFGMGRGAGNLATELITRFINENIKDKYDVGNILNVMDSYILPIKSRFDWGYSAPYYIAAVNNCHPNYASFLIGKQTLCINDVKSIINTIPVSERHLYNANLITKLYSEHLSHFIDDKESLSYLKSIVEEKKILILAPGRSLIEYRNKIVDFIKLEKPIIIAVNFIPDFCDYDIIFISNLKRFNNLDTAVDLIKEKLICTSNITVRDDIKVINYINYLNENSIITDNAGLMLLNIIKNMNFTDAFLAGFDGFDFNINKNYYNQELMYNIVENDQIKINEAVTQYFEKYRINSNIKFITPTIYDKEELNNVQVSNI